MYEDRPLEWTGPPDICPCCAMASPGQDSTLIRSSTNYSDNGSTSSLASSAPLGSNQDLQPPCELNRTFPSHGTTGNHEDSVPRVKNGKKRQCSTAVKLSVLLSSLNLSPWEQWAVCKVQEQRQQLEKQAQEDQRREDDVRRREADKAERKRRAEQKHKEWVRLKVSEMKLKKTLAEQKAQAAEEAKAVERRQAHEKALQKYNAWLEGKQAEKREHSQRKKEQTEKMEKEKQKQKEEAEQAFHSWQQKIKHRSRPKPHALAYVNGQLVDYFSHSICQTPAFCNPIPWEAPDTPISTSACVPSQKPERQKRPHAQLSHTACQWEVHS